jgi:hypothetical protein
MPDYDWYFLSFSASLNVISPLHKKLPIKVKSSTKQTAKSNSSKRVTGLHEAINFTS